MHPLMYKKSLAVEMASVTKHRAKIEPAIPLIPNPWKKHAITGVDKIGRSWPKFRNHYDALRLLLVKMNYT